jgi:PLP dependent protein
MSNPMEHSTSNSLIGDDGGAGGGGRRRAEIAANLAALDDRLAAACAAVGRRREDVTIVAVTKTFPADDVRHLAGLGLTDIGENRDQEAAPKAAACAGLAVRWHFVGRLQTNKCRSVATYADVVHSVDRSRLVDALSTAATTADRQIVCLVQVNLDENPRRGGAAAADVPQLADALAAAGGLRVGGVMAIAPLGVPPRPSFERLAKVAAVLRTSHPEATIVSAGMSADLEDAIACGATHVRVGTALLGSRAPVR